MATYKLEEREIELVEQKLSNQENITIYNNLYLDIDDDKIFEVIDTKLFLDAVELEEYILNKIRSEERLRKIDRKEYQLALKAFENKESLAINRFGEVIERSINEDAKDIVYVLISDTFDTFMKRLLNKKSSR